jgi:hypothetical protein
MKTNLLTHFIYQSFLKCSGEERDATVQKQKTTHTTLSYNTACIHCKVSQIPAPLTSILTQIFRRLNSEEGRILTSSNDYSFRITNRKRPSVEAEEDRISVLE